MAERGRRVTVKGFERVIRKDRAPEMGHTCGTCGDRTIVVYADAGAWHVRCGNGHEWLPVPGEYVHIFAEPVGSA